MQVIKNTLHIVRQFLFIEIDTLLHNVATLAQCNKALKRSNTFRIFANASYT